MNEADSVTFSVLNSANPSSVMNEADSVTFSVLNSANPRLRHERSRQRDFLGMQRCLGDVSRFYQQFKKALAGDSPSGQPRPLGEGRERGQSGRCCHRAYCSRGQARCRGIGRCREYPGDARLLRTDGCRHPG